MGTSRRSSGWTGDRLHPAAESALLFAWVLSLTVAITGSVESGIGGAIGATFGVFLIARARDREFRQLDKHDQQLVLDVVGSGVASGEVELDRIALRRLGNTARGTGRVERLCQAVVMIMLLAGPAVAAVRAGYLWLLCLIPAVMLTWTTLLSHRGAESADARLERLIRTPGVLERSA